MLFYSVSELIYSSTSVQKLHEEVERIETEEEDDRAIGPAPSADQAGEHAEVRPFLFPVVHKGLIRFVA